MSQVKIKIEKKIELNSTLQEKYGLKNPSLIIRGIYPIRAEVDKGNIYYLGKHSFEDFELDYCVIGKGNCLKLLDENELELPKLGLIYEDIKFKIMEILNQEVNEGKFDSQIREKYKKDKSSVKVKLADIAEGKHRASILNTEKNHNWIPKGEIDSDRGLKIPMFQARYAGSGIAIGNFDSIRNCCLEIKDMGGGSLSAGNVRLCLRGKRSTVEGYTFDFINSNSKEVTDWLEQAELDASGED